MHPAERGRQVVAAGLSGLGQGPRDGTSAGGTQLDITHHGYASQKHNLRGWRVNVNGPQFELRPAIFCRSVAPVPTRHSNKVRRTQVKSLWCRIRQPQAQWQDERKFPGPHRCARAIRRHGKEALRSTSRNTAEHSASFFEGRGTGRFEPGVADCVQHA